MKHQQLSYNLLSLILVVIGFWLIVNGQKSVGMINLMTMFVGLGLCLSSLYLYNKKFN